MKKTESYLRYLILCLAVLGVQTVTQAADRSIQNFVSQREKWDKLIGVSQTLEGRISTFNSLSLRFRNCPIPFYYAGKIPKLDNSVQNVEVTGQLARENGRLLFKITSLNKMPSDMESFVTEESKIDLTNPREWYSLGDWATNRADFYNDDELKKVAQEAYRKGVKAEYNQLVVKQPETLLKLASRVQEYKLDPQFSRELQHEALVLEWEQLQKQPKADVKPLLSQILKFFPTAKTPQNKDNPQEREQYLKSQNEIFQQSDESKQNRLMRWFYAEIILDRILKNLADGGSNGFEIAAAIAKEIPERTELVQKYQNMQLDFDLNRVDELPRQYVLDLSQEFQRRGMKDKARQTLVNWIESRRKKLDPNDADGRVRLARDLMELTDDKQAAAKVLLRAWELNPKSTEASVLLARLGFMLQEDQWLNPKEVKEFRDDPIRKAIRNGTVVAGMNRDQVQKVLGAPSQIGRSISGGKINELWIYGEVSNQSLVIQLARKRRSDELTVVRIRNAQMSASPLTEEADPVE
ncbi:MAG: hypothetical protein KDA74_05275 [Planctomycetaceae bacterium]|nr:hypothetical protein [Planctomycetaceae bacterium]